MFVEVSNPTMTNIVSTRKKTKKNAEEFQVNECGEEIHYDKFGDVYYLRRNAKRTKRKQAPTTPLIAWLRQRTSPTIYGTGVTNRTATTCSRMPSNRKSTLTNGYGRSGQSERVSRGCHSQAQGNAELPLRGSFRGRREAVFQGERLVRVVARLR